MIRDRSQWPELAVLATVLAIAAIASYIHLRQVWVHAGAPVAAIGPLTVDGLFAAAWLRMRRRRHQGDPVGFLAWLALGLALVATVAGNLSAAWIAGHRDPLSLVKRARLLAEGAGRKRLAKELGVKEHEARQWLAGRGDPVAAS